MKRYLLDTGILSTYLRGRSKITELVDPWIVNDESATSILVYGEIIEYVRSASDFTRRRDHLQEVLTGVAPHYRLIIL